MLYKGNKVASRLLPVFFCTFWLVTRELLVEHSLYCVPQIVVPAVACHAGCIAVCLGTWHFTA
jgi:hypothetical protein